MSLLKEFRPALLFLGKFLALYFVGNILYGLYVESYDQQADGITRSVTAQTSWLLNLLGYETQYGDVPGVPKIAMSESGEVALNVYEGCNGINVMIVFVGFLFAFGGPGKALAVFLPAGLLIIHLFNLIRIALLFVLAINDSRQFYYYHKYFFTATLYVVVFTLWALWVVQFNEKRDVKAPA